MSPVRETPEGMGYELVWQDDFNGNALDPQKWEVRGVGPRALGFVSPEAVTVGDGCLKLHALRKDGRIWLGAVGTQSRFMTRYGYSECRAQLQRSPVIWAAFWIQSTEISKGEDPAIYGAEIDIMEFFKKLGTDIVSHNVHWAYGPHQRTTHIAMDIQCGDRALVHDIRYENIRAEIDDVCPTPRMQGSRDERYMEDPKDQYVPNLLVIVIGRNPYSQDPERGNVRDVTYADVSVTGGRAPRSFFNGLDAQHTVQGVTINNLRLNGKPANTAADANLSLGQYVSDVRFDQAAK